MHRRMRTAPYCEARLEFVDDAARLCVEGGKQCCRAVPLVVSRHRRRDRSRTSNPARTDGPSEPGF